MHTYIHRYINIYIYMCVYVYIDVCVYVYINVYRRGKFTTNVIPFGSIRQVRTWQSCHKFDKQIQTWIKSVLCHKAHNKQRCAVQIHRDWVKIQIYFSIVGTFIFAPLICIYEVVYENINTYIDVFIFMYICMHRHIYNSMYIYIDVCIYVSMYTHAYIYVIIYVYICIYIYIYI